MANEMGLTAHDTPQPLSLRSTTLPHPGLSGGIKQSAPKKAPELN